jgi:hypothetical protein
MMWFKENRHFAKNEIPESDVPYECPKNQTTFHQGIHGREQFDGGRSKSRAVIVRYEKTDQSDSTEHTSRAPYNSRSTVRPGSVAFLTWRPLVLGYGKIKRVRITERKKRGQVCL